MGYVANQGDQLFIYPVKSLRPVEVTAAEITNEGLRFDRQYVLVKPPTDEQPLAEHITGKSCKDVALEPLHIRIDAYLTYSESDLMLGSTGLSQ